MTRWAPGSATRTGTVPEWSRGRSMRTPPSHPSRTTSMFRATPCRRIVRPRPPLGTRRPRPSTCPQTFCPPRAQTGKSDNMFLLCIFLQKRFAFFLQTQKLELNEIILTFSSDLCKILAKWSCYCYNSGCNRYYRASIFCISLERLSNSNV